METSENDKRTIEEKLSKALEENRLLHERLADLDIALNMDTVELKRKIEEVSGERDELLRENEFLLEDYTARDYKIQELIRELEIKQLMIHETSSYLSTATDRIRNLERQCAILTSPRYDAGPAAEGTAGSGVHGTLLDEIKREYEEALGQKDLEIESLSRSVEELRVLNTQTVSDAGETQVLDAGGGPVSLEHTLMDMEHSLAVLEKRISKASETGLTDQDEILLKLDDAQREIFSLRECYRSLLEVLRKTDEEARRGGPPFIEVAEPEPEPQDSMQSEIKILREEIERFQEQLRERDSEIAALRTGMEDAAAEALGEKLRLETRITESGHIAEDRLKTAEASIAELETALSQETGRSAEMEEVLRRNEIVLKEMHEHFLSESASLERQTEGMRLRYEQTSESLSAAEKTTRALEAAVLVKEEQIATLNNRIALQQQEEEHARDALSRAEEALKASEAEAALKKTEAAELSDRLARHTETDEMKHLLTTRLDEILEGVRRRTADALPVVAAAPPEKKTAGSRLLAIVATVAAVAIIMALAAGKGIVKLWPPASGINVHAEGAPAWAKGVKQAKAGDYNISLTFLNREAVHVLGFDDLISDSMLAKETVALLVVKTQGRCIPESFVESPEKNMRFVDLQDRREPLISHDVFSSWKKTVYKKDACGNGQPGVVYLKHLIAARRLPGASGLEIRGLDKEPVLLR